MGSCSSNFFCYQAFILKKFSSTSIAFSSAIDRLEHQGGVPRSSLKKLRDSIFGFCLDSDSFSIENWSDWSDEEKNRKSNFQNQCMQIANELYDHLEEADNWPKKYGNDEKLMCLDEETYKKYDEESKTRSKYRPNDISLRIIMTCYLKWMQLICQLNTEIL